VGEPALTYAIVEYSVDDMSDVELEPILDATNRINREAQPRAVAMTVDDLRTFAVSPGMIQHRYAVHDDSGRLVALGAARYPGDGTNADILICQIQVLPEHRRRGVGTLLLERVTGEAERLGRHTLQSWYLDTVPAAAAFVDAIGARRTLEFYENVLRIADLDRGLMESWSRIGQERAPGYSVRLIEGSLPEGLLADIAHLYYVLERDMPVSDGFEPRDWNAARVREMQEHYLEGVDSLVALAIHEGSGTAVGMSQLIRRKSDPTTWLVTVTMVDPEHRGRSLGKWLKGTVNVAALEQWPGGIYQETGNAFTNEPMLAINRAMGFEHEHTAVDCLLGVETARAYLASRS
jgi:GNAT superfamily N-acetyltransferase